MKLLIVACLLLAGCGTTTPPMTNAQISGEIHFCMTNGLRAVHYINFDGETVRIECRPNGE